jgi:hypothetical protein
VRRDECASRAPSPEPAPKVCGGRPNPPIPTETGLEGPRECCYQPDPTGAATSGQSSALRESGRLRRRSVAPPFVQLSLRRLPTRVTRTWRAWGARVECRDKPGLVLDTHDEPTHPDGNGPRRTQFDRSNVISTSPVPRLVLGVGIGGDAAGEFSDW